MEIKSIRLRKHEICAGCGEQVSAGGYADVVDGKLFYHGDVGKQCLTPSEKAELLKRSVFNTNHCCIPA